MAEQQQQEDEAKPSSANETETQIQNQNQNRQKLPPLPSSTTTTSSCFNGNGRKRDFDHFELLQSSPYFKMRILANDLRSLFLQVLGAPDIQNCDAAQGLQEKLKLMQDLCRQMTVENNTTTGKCKIQEASRPFAKPVEERRFPTGNNVEKTDYNKVSGTYIVGGSAFGWNFIMFHGNRSEYYGRTKEAFRAGK